MSFYRLGGQYLFTDWKGNIFSQIGRAISFYKLGGQYLFTDWKGNIFLQIGRPVSFYRLEGQYLSMKLLNSVTLALKHSSSFFTPNSTLHVHRSSHLKCSMWFEKFPCFKAETPSEQ